MHDFGGYFKNRPRKLLKKKKFSNLKAAKCHKVESKVLEMRHTFMFSSLNWRHSVG